MQISLDGIRKEHDAIRGTGTFRQSLHPIKLLKARGVRVLVSFTAQKIISAVSNHWPGFVLITK